MSSEVRTLLVKLRAETAQYEQAMAKAAQSTEQVVEASRASQQKSKSLLGELDALGVATNVSVAAIGSAVVMSAANFEQGMSNVRAATHGTAEEMDALADAAKKAGADTAFSATEAAAGIENLAKAGVSTEDILSGGLAGALDLAAAGQLAVADAAEYTATALTQFQLAGDQASHVADLLAAGAGKAQGEVADMANGLNYAGVPAANLGVSIEETAGTIALLAKNGVIGEQAGTSLRGMLSSLTSPSKAAKNEMDALGISVFDAQGKFVGFEGVAQQLQSRMGKLSDAERASALGRIFGNEQLQAANVLYREGAGGVAEWTRMVDDAGYAAETAAERMNNTKGAWEEFMGTLETTMIGHGEGSLGAFGAILSGATAVLGVIGEVQTELDDLASVGPLKVEGLWTSVTNPMLGVANALGNVWDQFDDSDEPFMTITEVVDGMRSQLDVATTSSRSLAGEQVAVAQSSEAEAKALEKVAKSARDTAGGFVNLGKSLDDNKVSFSDWLKELEEQNRALKRFTANAERAGEKGVKQGLIEQLKAAGPEGARRMQQLANASDKEIARANRAWKRGQGAIEDFVAAATDASRLPDIETGVRVKSDEAMNRLRVLRTAMAQIKDKTVTVRINSSGGISKGNTGMGPQDKAMGGPIRGPGTGTSDEVPIWASNGEFMMRAAAVEHYGEQFMHDFNAMRIPKFAAGGPVGGSRDAKGKSRMLIQASTGDMVLPNLLEKFERLAAQVEKSRKAITAETAVRDQLKGAFDTLAASVADRYKSDLFGGESNAFTNPALDPTAQIQADRAEIAALQKARATLAGKGLDGAALDELIAKGDLSEVQAMANWSTQQVREYERLYNLRAQEAQAAGVSAANAAYGEQLRESNRELREMKAQLRDANKALNAIKNQGKGRDDRVANRAVRQINGMAVHGRRNARVD